MRVAPVFEGTARINDDAALAARLHWCRRRTGDARRSRWRPTCIGAVAATGGARRPHLSRQRAAAQPLLRRRLPWSQTPDICLTGQPYASQILTFRPFPIKPHGIFIGKG